MQLVDTLPMIFVATVFMGIIGYLIFEFARAKKVNKIR